MKRVVLMLTLECQDDVPPHVLEWMAGNVAEHAAHEFDDDYDPDWMEPPYEGPPLAGGVTVAVDGVEIDWDADLRRELEATKQMIQRRFGPHVFDQEDDDGEQGETTSD